MYVISEQGDERYKHAYLPVELNFGENRVHIRNLTKLKERKKTHTNMYKKKPGGLEM